MRSKLTDNSTTVPGSQDMYEALVNPKGAWPNGADFDPATLHDWPEHNDAFAARAREWERVSA